MSVAGGFLLLGMAIAVVALGRRLVPVVMPGSWFKTVVVGWLGGLGGSFLARWLWPSGFVFVHINLVGAVIGAIVLVLIVGLIPFIRIFFGRTELPPKL